MSLPCMHIQSWGHCSFFFFLLAILFVLINSFVAVLVDAYCEIREEQGAVFSDVRVGTFMFNFFLNKIKAFHSQIACGKAQLSHKFLSKAPTMGNSHLFLVIVDTFVLNHSKTISSTVLTTKVLNLRMTKAQNLRQIALMNASIPLSCLKLWKRKMPGIKTSQPTSRAMTLNERATTECTFLLLKHRIGAGQDVLKSAYIPTLLWRFQRKFLRR